MICHMVSRKECENVSGFRLKFFPISLEYALSFLYGMYAEHRGSLFPVEITAALEKAHIRNKNIPPGFVVEAGTYRITMLFKCVRFAPK